MAKFVKRDVCPVCNSSSFEQIYSVSYHSDVMTNYLTKFYEDQEGFVELKELTKVNYTLLNCLICESVYQQNIPDSDLMNTLYSKWINSEYTRIRTSSFGQSYFRNMSLEIIGLIRYFKRRPIELNFLDFGMGWAKWSIMAKAFGVNSYGLELSEEKILFAKENGIEVLDFKDLSEYKFDYINTEQVFEHIPEPLKDLRILVKSLKENGIIKISVPNGNDIKQRLIVDDWTAPKGSKNSLNAVAPLEHINCFSTNSILKMAQKCNLEPIVLPKYSIQNDSIMNAVKYPLKLIRHRILNNNKDSTSLYFIKLPIK